MTVTITVRGPFSVAAAARFWHGFRPATSEGPDEAVLRLAFATDDGHHHAGAAVRAAGEGTVAADLTGDPVEPGQLARILSLDVDGTAFPEVAAADPVAAGLVAAYPGLRPVCLPTPYEAAVWSILSSRSSRKQAAAIMARVAADHGPRLDVAGRPMHAFPGPAVLREVAGELPGVWTVKREPLRGVAEAALDGALDAAMLRAMPADEALRHLQTLRGIGPFSAQLILIRGAGHPDVFPRHEPRLHEAMRRAYGVKDLDEMERIAARWIPFRSWVALLLRTDAQASR
jgi:DNA-3-methyladenine glycosylase II